MTSTILRGSWTDQHCRACLTRCGSAARRVFCLGQTSFGKSSSNLWKVDGAITKKVRQGILLSNCDRPAICFSFLMCAF